MELPRGLILVRHSGFAKVNMEDCLEVLPDDWVKLDRKEVEITYSENVELAKLYHLNFNQCALEHRRQFREEIAPLLERNSNYVVVYFGLAPIPLAIDLGQLFHNYRNFIAYQLHHKTKEWYRALTDTISDNSVEVDGVPLIDQKGIGSALIRISSSHYVNPEETELILSNAAEIDIRLANVDEDAITNPELMGEVVNAVKSTMDDLANNRSELKEIHLFAAIPCGLAFLIGTKISPNIHPFIQTYQYSKTEDPCYRKAVLIKAAIQPGRTITEEDAEQAMELRKLADSELQGNIRTYCKFNQRMSKNREWYFGLLPDLGDGIMNSSLWNSLPALCYTSLSNDVFGFDLDVIEDGFCWKNGTWYVDDNFFISVNNRIESDEKIKQAIRLFLFHESLHYKQHNLTESTAMNIGSFPKVLETADYQADVYAILNEYGYHSHLFGEVTDPKAFFLDAINTATETMWSFDDMGIELTEIQIRRLNRYMIWYWQYVRIERYGDTIDAIVNVLKEKPVIELNGLETKEENNRFYFELEQRKSQHLELGVFHDNKVIRGGSASNMPIENLVAGVKEMTGESILKVMRSFLQ